VDFVTNFLSILTVVGDIFIGLFLINLIYRFFSKKNLINFDFIKDESLLFAFIIALMATSGSLFYSEIAGYTPCELCWFQRIFMYPLVIFLGIGLIRKAKDLFYYVTPMTIIGALISIRHYITQVTDYASSCSAEAVSCSTKYYFTFGYITMPMMALTAFLLITILLYIRKET